MRHAFVNPVFLLNNNIDNICQDSAFLCPTQSTIPDEIGFRDTISIVLFTVNVQ